MNFLTDEKQKELKAQHRTERDGRIRDRIKAILLSNKGWSIKKIAEALLIDEMTVSRHLDEFSESQKLKPENGGSLSLLSIQQTEELIQHLENHTYVKVKDICQYVATTYCVTYTISGMTKWMHDNEFSFKKPKKVPAKANEEKQKAFVEIYNNLVATTPSNEPILHIDAVHPTMATKESYGWIRTGKDKIIATNASRTRMNIAGALHLPTLDVIQENFDTINGTNINALLGKVRETYKNAPNIHIILDQAGYHKSDEVKQFAEKNNIKLHFLPAYSPNLNPIERLWKVMNEKTRNNRYFSTAKEFRKEILAFFEHWPSIKDTFRSRINDNFQILKTTSSS